MWYALQPDRERTLQLDNSHSIYPVSDTHDAELVVRLRAVLRERIRLASERLAHIEYVVESVDASLVLTDQPPAPWEAAQRVGHEGFEVMLSDKGAFVRKDRLPELPNRHLAWLQTISEEIRGFWLALPEESVLGTRWETKQEPPGGLPAGAARDAAAMRTSYVITRFDAQSAEVEADYALRALLVPPASRERAEGTGQLQVHLGRERGPLQGIRASTVTLLANGRRPQHVRVRTEIAPGLAQSEVATGALPDAQVDPRLA